MEYTATIHHEDASYWAQIRELPGIFASGDTLDQLLDGLKEAVGLAGVVCEPTAAELRELKLAVIA